MRITTMASIGEIEVSVPVTIEDIIIALDECGSKTDAATWSGFNSIAQFLKAISAERIAAMTDGQRSTIGNFLREQAARFTP